MTIEQENLRKELRKKPMREYEEDIVRQRFGRNAQPNLSGNGKRATFFQAWNVLKDIRP